MNAVSTLIALFSMIDRTSGALTAAIYNNPYATIVDIKSTGKVSPRSNGLDEVIGITHDTISGKVYALSGFQVGSQTLVEYDCNDASSFSLVADIAPTVLLSCLTSGPSGIYAVDILSKEIGIIRLSDGIWNPVSMLPGPYDAYAIAQDSKGVLHYINGSGKYYTSDPSTKTKSSSTFLKEKKGMVFPTQKQGFCGDFSESDGSDNGASIVTASYDGKGGIVRYSFSDMTATQEFTMPVVLLNDVTRGPFTCSTTAPTPVSLLKEDITTSVPLQQITTYAPVKAPPSSPVRIPSNVPSVTPSKTLLPVNTSPSTIIPIPNNDPGEAEIVMNGTTTKTPAVIPNLRVKKKGKDYIPVRGNVEKKSKYPPITTYYPTTIHANTVKEEEAVADHSSIEIEYVLVLVPIAVPVPVPAPATSIFITYIPVPVVIVPVLTVPAVTLPPTEKPTPIQTNLVSPIMTPIQQQVPNDLLLPVSSLNIPSTANPSTKNNVASTQTEIPVNPKKKIPVTTTEAPTVQEIVTSSISAPPQIRTSKSKKSSSLFGFSLKNNATSSGNSDTLLDYNNLFND